MELVNEAYRVKDRLYADPEGRETVRFATATAASLIFPFAPHLGAEIYEALEGRKVWEDPWPEADLALLDSDTFTLVVQVNGKRRDQLEVAAGTPEAEVVALARAARTSAATSTATRSSRRSTCRASSSTWWFAERSSRG